MARTSSPLRGSFSPCALTSHPALQDFHVLDPAAPSVKGTVYLLLTTSDLIGHTRSKMTFLSITVSLASLQLNKGCRSSRLFKESQHSYLTDPGGGTLHVYTPLLPKKQACAHKQLQWEDFTALYQGFFSHAEGMQKCYKHNTKGQAPSQLLLNSLARFIQRMADSGETFLPPVRSTWHLTVFFVPLDCSITGC